MDNTGRSHTHELLATLLGSGPLLHPISEQDTEPLLRLARHEGVPGLLHARLATEPAAGMVPAPLRTAIMQAAQGEVARSLYLESHARRILARLEQAGIATLLLKGSALAYWAYAAPWQRSCGDIDLLLRSRVEVERAGALLAELGYQPASGALPGDLVSFELTLAHGAEGTARVEVDLHWRIASSPLFAFRLDWEELDARAVALPKLADGARGLMPVHAWLHACMHRLQNRTNHVPDTLKWLYDLDVLGRGFSETDWHELAQLAGERGLAATCLDGSRAAASHFGEVMPAAIQKQLALAATHETMDISRLDRWWYVQRMNLAAYPDLRRKLRWLRQRLLPDRTHLRARYGGDTGIFKALLLRLRAAARR